MAICRESTTGFLPDRPLHPPGGKRQGSSAELGSGHIRVLISGVIPALTTERLILRQWRDSDREPFRRMNADAAVMEFMPKRLTADESDVLAERIQKRLVERGFGLFAAELRKTGSFIGFIGLSAPAFEAHFTPCVEIGWRLAREFWGSGYATEGAVAVLRLAFMSLELSEVVSFTAALNARSRRVMERLGMRRSTKDDFDHPLLSAADPLRPHVLYRLARVDWLPDDQSVPHERASGASRSTDTNWLPESGPTESAALERQGADSLPSRGKDGIAERGQRGR
jgi:RimJ/RimL family protein N-acetyltransferase